MEHVCEHCHTTFHGRADARHCSATCRQRAKRKRDTPTTVLSDHAATDDAFERRVEAEVRKRVEAERRRSAWRGFTHAEAQLIRRSLHPDNSASETTRAEAFRIFNEAPIPVYEPKASDLPNRASDLKRKKPRR